MKKWVRVILLLLTLACLFVVPLMFLRSAATTVAQAGRLKGTLKEEEIIWINESARNISGVGIVRLNWVAFLTWPMGRGGCLSQIDSRVGKIVNISVKENATLLETIDDLLILTTADCLIAIDRQTNQEAWKVKHSLGQILQVSKSKRGFIASSASSVASFDMNGRMVWSSQFEKKLNGGAALIRDAIHVLDVEQMLHTLDPATGKRLRAVKLNFPATGPPMEAGDNIVLRVSTWIPSGDALVALDPASSKEVWRFAPSRGSYWNQPTSSICVIRDSLYFGHHRFLYCLNLSNGLERWNKEFAPNAVLGGPTALESLVVVGDGKAFRGVNASNGDEQWRAEVPILPRSQTHTSVRPMVVGDNLLLPYQRQLIFVSLPSQPTPRSVLADAVGFQVVLLWSSGGLILLLLITATVFHLRRLFLAICSLLLCIATLFLWLNSFRAEHFIGHRSTAASTAFRSDTCRGIVSRFGALSFGVRQRVWDDAIRRVIPLSPRGPWCVTQEPLIDPAFPVVTPPADLGLTNFVWSNTSRWSGTALGDQVNKTLTLPHWVLVLFFAIWPLAWLTGFWRDRRRYPKGCCKKCGYDLRGGHEVCPECGQPIGAATPRA